MPHNDIKLLMERFVSFINAPSRAQATELVEIGAAFRVPYQEEPVFGPEGYLEVLGTLRSAFPDIQWDLVETVVENDTAAARFIARGTHQGDFLGAPATGRAVAFSAMNFYRWRNGKIYEEFALPDLMALLRQIGAFV